MKIVTCPSCRAEFEVELAAGAEFTCGACQEIVVVPADRPVIQPKPPVRRPPPAVVATRPHAESPADRKSPALAIGLGVGAVAIIALLFVLLGSNGDEPERRPTVDPDKGATQERPQRQRSNEPLDPYSAARRKAELEGTVEALAEFGDLAWKRAEDARQRGDEGAQEQHRKHYRWAYKRLIERDTNHAVARARSGYVKFDDAALKALLGLAFLPRSVKDNLEFLIEEVNESRHEEPKWPRSGPFWMSARRGSGRELAVITARIEKLREVEDQKKTDPYYGKAQTMARRLINELSKPGNPDFHVRGIKGDAFVSAIRKPYILLIQKAGLNDEEHIAETWGDVLQDLQKTFYAKYGKATGIGPVTEPVAVIVLRDAQEYTKYLRKGDPFARVTSGGHFEPWSMRLVVYQQTGDQEKETLFHEGTHQIIDWGMKSARNYAIAGSKQCLWFSEGIADYFGGHESNYDEATLSYIYTPGLINTERIATLEKARDNKALFSIRNLLKYTRNHFQQDKKDPSKSQKTLIAYAQGWGMCYFLNNWENGKYSKEFMQYLKLELDGKSGEKAFREAFGKYGLDKLEKEFLAMVDYLVKANREKRIIKGRIRDIGKK